MGWPDALAAAEQLAGEADVTRTHLARALVEQGAAESMNAVFRRFLGFGKPAYVAVSWPVLDDVVAWIKAAGGVAVIAHPHSYSWTSAWRRRIADAFKTAGGDAIEVVCGNSTPNDIGMASGLARRFDLLASQGSDFHTPSVPWVKLGGLQDMPADLTPVWESFNTATSGPVSSC
ncbi:hypothetical protein [Alkalilimnicola ehrlichii]|uniref:hypothetical protein n=1 Tax=Alkalilimnicola ehrlichii TaxID=351052 RepID=UPI001C6DE6B5|nr:hypothetical protein [Alkalilimnicola ehrlichii]